MTGFNNLFINLPPRLPYDQMTHDLQAIGFRIGDLTSKASVIPDIEKTLYFASIEGLIFTDYRVLSILTTWLSVHSKMINADKLYKIIIANQAPDLVRAYWRGVGEWLRKDLRLRKYLTLYSGPRLDLYAEGPVDLMIQRKGEDRRFKDTCVRASNEFLRDRMEDVDTREILLQKHPTYYWRAVIGANYRADIWSHLTRYPKSSTADAARATNCNIVSTKIIHDEWKLVNILVKNSREAAA